MNNYYNNKIIIEPGTYQLNIDTNLFTLLF